MIYRFADADKTPLQHKKIAIIAANFYEEIVENLLTKSKEVLAEYQVENYDVLYAPGAFEIPFMCEQLITQYDGIITLGAVIQGETPHFDFVCNECANGVRSISVAHNKPISFGVLTTNNMEQAIGRAGGYKGNKGEEATIALLDSLLFAESLS